MARSSTTRVGNGEGWGGPANGASTSRFQPGESGGGHLPENRAKAASRAEEMRDVLYGIATNKKAHAMVRVNAADKLLDRIEGKAPQTNINRNTNDLSSLSDAELDAELARREGTPPGAAAGTGPAGDPAQPDRVEH